MLETIKETVDFLKQRTQNFTPEVGIILGSGLGNLASQIIESFSISYEDIPNFPVSTVKGHKGRLIFGTFSGKRVVAMQGRFHFYEGYSMKELTFPVRVLKHLGIDLLLLSNAAGGVNPDFEVGDIMFISDHINTMPSNPLNGKNDDNVGTRFPDMSEAYDKILLEKAKKIAEKNNIPYKTGVYVGVQGPNYETPSEYKYFHIIGGDAVGMSTVPEVIVARHMNLKCFAVSIITDLGVSGKIVEISHEDVIKAANAAEPKMTIIISELLKEI